MDQLDALLSNLRPGAQLDLHGYSVNSQVLDSILDKLTVSGSGRAQFGECRFDGVCFIEPVNLAGARFARGVSFAGAHFLQKPNFSRVHFEAETSLARAVFHEGAEFTDTVFLKVVDFGASRFNWEADFSRARFAGQVIFSAAEFGTEELSSFPAVFSSVAFENTTLFDRARFHGNADFSGAKFTNIADLSANEFADAQFGGDAYFDGVEVARNVDFTRAAFKQYAGFRWANLAGANFGSARFEDDAVFTKTQFGSVEFNAAEFQQNLTGPMVCAGTFEAHGLVLQRPVTVEIAAPRLELEGARFAEKATWKVRYTAIDLSNLVAPEPVIVAYSSSPFRVPTHQSAFEEADESALVGKEATAKILSVAGVDAANLALTNLDLSECVFSDSHHLDQIRFVGCTFARVPHARRTRRLRLPVRWWTKRKVVAEEIAWRSQGTGWAKPARDAWNELAPTGRTLTEPSAAAVASIYRQLRKALEDGGDQPGAADFYYGEMEARRHDSTAPWAERRILDLYWGLSAYALRATRALILLLTTASLTFLLLLAFGLPDLQPTAQITGNFPARGGQTVLTETTPSPVLTLPWDQRFSTERVDQASLVVVNSVIFRAPDTSLTGFGTWVEIISRIFEPILLGFAAFALRGRIQR